MSQEANKKRVEDRVAGRDQAGLLIEVACLESMSPHYQSAFWEELLKRARQHAIEPQTLSARAPKPMTDAESREFGKRKFPWGKFSGSHVDDVELRYLEWFVKTDEDGREFVTELRRYLLSPRVQSEVNSPGDPPDWL